MISGLPISFEALLPHLPAWLLVLFRLTGIFVFAPMFGSQTIPARVKVFLALGLSFCVYPVLLAPGGLVEPVVRAGLSLWSLVSAVAMELLIGIVIGYGASLPLLGMEMAGQVADQQMGLGIAGVLNPEINEEAGIVGQFFFMLALAVFVILGGHRVMLAVLVGSFSNVPLGGGWVDGRLLDLVLGLLMSVFELAIRVSAPLLCLVFLETVAMGFIARTVPQMNIMSVGFALRIMIGTAILIGAVAVKNGVFVEALRQALSDLAGFFAPGSATRLRG